LTLPITRPLDGDILGPDDGIDVTFADNPFSSTRRSLRVPIGLNVNEIVSAQIRGPRLWKHVRAWVMNADETEAWEVPRDQWDRVRLKHGTRLVLRVQIGNGGGGGGKSLLSILLSIAVLALAFFAAPLLAGVLGVSSSLAFGLVSMVGRLLISALIPPPTAQSKGNSDSGTQRVFALTGVSNKAAPFEPTPRVYGKMRVFPPLASAPWNELQGEFTNYLRMLFDFGSGPLKISDLRIGDTPIERFQDVQIEVGHNGDETGSQPEAGTYFAGYQDDRTTFTLFPTDAHQESVSVKLDKGSPIVRSFKPFVNEGRVITVFPKGCIFYHTDGRKGASQLRIRAKWREVGQDDTHWIPLIPSEAYLGHSGAITEPVNNYPIYDDSHDAWSGTIGANWNDTDYLSRYPDVSANYHPSVENYDSGNSGGSGFPDPVRTFERGFHHYMHVGAWSGYTPSWVNPATSEYLLSDLREEQVFYCWRTPPLDATKEYEFKFERINGLRTDNENGTNEVNDFWLNVVQGFVSEAPTRVKGHALMAVRIKASEQLNGTLDNFSAVVEALLPVWNGSSWSAPQVTRSPAWAYADVLRGTANQRPVADNRLDLARIKDWADWCAGLNANGNPLALFDGVFDARKTVLETLNAIANTARGTFAMRDGKYSVVYDAQRTTPVQLFTPRNSRNFSGKKIFNVAPHALNIRFTNPDKAWQEDQLAVYSDGYTIDNATIFEQIEAFGITRLEQVHTYGRYLLAVNALRPEVYSFEADIEVLSCRRGDLIRFQHDVPRFGLSAGRIKAVTLNGGGNVIALSIDETVHVDAGRSYAIRARKNDGTIVTINLSMGSSTTDTKTLTLATPTAPASCPAVGDLFAYGELNRETVELLVRNIYRLDDVAATIECVDYSPAIFTADTDSIPAFDTHSTWPGQGIVSAPPVPVITNIVSDETAMILLPGGYQPAIKISIANQVMSQQIGPIRSDDYIEVRRRYRMDWNGDEGNGGGWIAPNQRFFNNPSAVVLTPVNDGDVYGLQLRRVTARGVASDWTTEITHTVIGRTTPPAQPTLFTAQAIADGVLLTWARNTEPDIAGYELRVGASWDGGTQLEPGKSPTTNTTQYSLPPQTVGSYTYRLKAIDTIGNLSTETTVALLISAPAVVVPVATFNGADVVISWPAVAGSHRIAFYRLKAGSADPIDVLTTNANLAAQWSGSRTFEVWAVDVAGNEGPHGSVSATINAAAAPGSFAHAFSQGLATLSWDAAVAGSLPVAGYELRYGATDWASSVLVAKINTTAFSMSGTWSGTRKFRLRAYDTAGNYGAETTRDVTINAPAAITLNATLAAGSYNLTWSEPASTLPIKEYEIRYGSTYATGTLVAVLKALSYSAPIDWTGTRKFWILARTTTDIDGTAASLDVAITAPAAPSVSDNFNGTDIVLSWSVPASALPIARYEVRYGGTDFASATSLGFADSTIFQTRGNWSGTRTFRVAAIDTGGNVGADASHDVVIVAPGAIQSPNADIVDNNVLLRWGAPVIGSLPVDHYEIRRGSTWAGGSSIGNKTGTFTIVFETLAGSYTYWITAFDTAGNQGTPQSLTVTVNAPPDYILKANQNIDLSSGVFTNAFFDGDHVAMPAITGRTFAQHFTDNSWSTPDDQIGAGFPIYVQPTTTSAATAVFVYDYGTSIPAALITITPTYNLIAGSVAVTGKIEISSDGVSYSTAIDPGFAVLASSFRYVRVTIKAVATDTTGHIELTNVNLRLDLKQITDSGMGTAVSTDVGGTVVSFNKAFIDVDSITVTPAGTSSVKAVYDFVDVPNPTSFKVLLFNDSGTRVSGDFSWAARGV
jgi:predicted phage tail protein